MIAGGRDRACPTGAHVDATPCLRCARDLFENFVDLVYAIAFPALAQGFRKWQFASAFSKGFAAVYRVLIARAHRQRHGAARHGPSPPPHACRIPFRGASPRILASLPSNPLEGRELSSLALAQLLACSGALLIPEQRSGAASASAPAPDIPALGARYAVRTGREERTLELTRSADRAALLATERTDAGERKFELVELELAPEVTSTPLDP